MACALSYNIIIVVSYVAHMYNVMHNIRVLVSHKCIIMCPSCTIVAASDVSRLCQYHCGKVSQLCNVPSTIVAVSEAHVSQLCDACPQYLLSDAWWYDI